MERNLSFGELNQGLYFYHIFFRYPLCDDVKDVMVIVLRLLRSELNNLVLTSALYPQRIFKFMFDINCVPLAHLLALFCR